MPPARRTRFDRIGNAVLWPLAALLAFHSVAIMAFNGKTTDDFTTVYRAVARFKAGENVYNEVYEHVDPHYLYSPGATLVLTPLTWFGGLTTARQLFIILNAIAIVGALAVLVRLVGFHPKSAVLPGAVVAAFATESVANTLAFSNINGLLLLALAGYLYCLLVSRDWAAGVLLGLAILIKPIFLPLLWLPLVRGQWRTIVAGAIVPVVLNAAAWPLIPGADEYLTRTMPYLGETRDFANSSLPGISAYTQLPGTLYWPMYLFMGAAVALGVILLLKWKNTDPVMWALVTSGLIFAGVFLLSSLGQQYYSMLLFPMFLTVLLPRSPMHNWVAWLGGFLVFANVKWWSDEWIQAGRLADLFKATAGWTILILAITTTVVVWFFADADPAASRSATDPQERDSGRGHAPAAAANAGRHEVEAQAADDRSGWSRRRRGFGNGRSEASPIPDQAERAPEASAPRSAHRAQRA